MAKPATGVLQPLDFGRPASGALLAALAAAAAAVVVAGRLSGLGDLAEIETFALIFTSIVVEALPFVLLGATVSAAIEVLVPDRLFARVAKLPVALQLPGAALSGIAFPVCECGSVPVARRLITRGMHPAAGLAFMLASPIINPIVLASTFVAYSGRGVAVQMVLGRALLGLLLAGIAGWAIAGRHHVAGELLRPRAEGTGDACRPDHESGKRGRRFVDHLAGDFFFMGRFVVIGSALAAGLQTVIPQSVISGVASTPVVGAFALMGLAFVLSLCSEADAFVAVSFVQFPLGAQMAFLVFGPVVDTKLFFLYGATFTRTFLTRLLLLTVPVTLAGSLWFEVIVR